MEMRGVRKARRKMSVAIRKEARECWDWDWRERERERERERGQNVWMVVACVCLPLQV
jgi:type IV secretory pathway TrbF-like protein